MSASIATYVEFIRISFIKMLAFRMRYYTGIITYSIYVSVYWFIWEAVYQHGDTIGGFTLTEMTTYVAVGWASRTFYFNNIDHHIHDQVSSGQVSMDLMRPLDLQLMYMSIAVGESLFRLLLFALPTATVIFALFPVQLPASAMALAGFCLFTLIAFLINAQISFLIGLVSFKTHNVWGILRAKYVAIQLLSGLIIPLPLFPQTVQSVLELTPFPYLAAVPLTMYLGKLDQNAFMSALLIALVWIIILHTIGKLCWAGCRRGLIIHGG